MHEEMQVMEQLCYYPVHERVTKERIAKQYGWTLHANEIHIVEERCQNCPSDTNESQFIISMSVGIGAAWYTVFFPL